MSDVTEFIDRAAIELNPADIERLKYDLAAGIHEADTIAARYGFGDEAGLRAWLARRVWVASEARHLKSVLSSDQGTPERAKLKAQYAVEEAIPSMVGIIKNDLAAPRDKVDAFKELRQTSTIGAPSKEGSTSGAQFTLTINMPGGTETISATVAKSLPADDDKDEC